jgi:hypothetical protein
MTLATKNNALIVKDGKIAENCGCCGGWYCCLSLSCLVTDIQSVTVSIAAEAYVRKWQYDLTLENSRLSVTQVFKGNAYSGTLTLPLTSSPSDTNNKTFSSRFPTNPQGCTDSISVNINTAGVSLRFVYTSFAYLDEQPLHLAGAPDFKEPGFFSCNGQLNVSTALNYFDKAESFVACQGSVSAYGPYDGTGTLAYPFGTILVPEADQTVVSETGTKAFSITSVTFNV